MPHKNFFCLMAFVVALAELGAFFVQAASQDNTTNLFWSHAIASSINMTVLNAPGQWGNQTGDPMFDSYSYVSGFKRLLPLKLKGELMAHPSRLKSASLESGIIYNFG